MNFGVSCDNFLMLLVTGQQKVGKVKKKKELRGRCLPPQFYFFFLLFVWTNRCHISTSRNRGSRPPPLPPIASVARRCSYRNTALHCTRMKGKNRCLSSMSLHQATLNAMSRRHQWLEHSWSLAPHVLHASCICMRCVWRRVHSRFWNALGTPSAAHHIGTGMNDPAFCPDNTSDEDAQIEGSSEEESDDSTQRPDDTYNHLK